jgi:hypothetical protein
MKDVQELGAVSSTGHRLLALVVPPSLYAVWTTEAVLRIRKHEVIPVQAVDSHRAVPRRGSHIFQTVGSQMAVGCQAFRARRRFTTRKIPGTHFCQTLSRPSAASNKSLCGKTAPLWSSSRSSWLQIQRSGFDSRRYQIFWDLVCLERGLLSIVSTTEELLERKSRGSGIESREFGRGDPPGWPRGTLYPHKLAVTSPIIDSRSVGIVRLRTQATEFSGEIAQFPLSHCKSYIGSK